MLNTEKLYTPFTQADLDKELRDQMQCIERLIANQDHAGLMKKLTKNRKKIAYLIAEKTKIAESIANTKKIKDYIFCL